MGKELFRQREVTTNMIFGAIVTYLLAAVAFAYLFEILELLQPGSFSGIADYASAQELGDALLYFSLVSLTTVGYGDITPVFGVARPLAVLEGAFGNALSGGDDRQAGRIAHCGWYAGRGKRTMKMSKNPNQGGRKKRWHISEPRCITSSMLIRVSHRSASRDRGHCLQAQQACNYDGDSPRRI